MINETVDLLYLNGTLNRVLWQWNLGFHFPYSNRPSIILTIDYNIYIVFSFHKLSGDTKGLGILNVSFEHFSFHHPYYHHYCYSLRW